MNLAMILVLLFIGHQELLWQLAGLWLALSLPSALIVQGLLYACDR